MKRNDIKWHVVACLPEWDVMWECGHAWPTCNNPHHEHHHLQTDVVCLSLELNTVGLLTISSINCVRTAITEGMGVGVKMVAYIRLKSRGWRRLTDRRN